MKIRLLILSLFASTCALADDIRQLAPTVVTATRVETNSFDLPVSIDVVGSESIHNGQAEMNLSESLIRVPGLTAQNRTQMAQDPEIASRGFGARSAFGVRGVRIIYDGIPLSMPDGIGQPGNVDLSTVKAIEVMRGPFSSLYGSSSGGIIQLISKDISKTPQIDFGFMAGSYGTTKETIGASGALKDFEYSISADRYDTDGYRDHSSSWKEQQTAKINFKISDSTKLTVLANHFKSEAEDPLGLAIQDGFDQRKFNPYRYISSKGVLQTPVTDLSTNKYYSAFSSPKLAPDAAGLSNTRVSRSNTQVGLKLEHLLNDTNQIKLIAGVGHRDNLQYLALPITYGYADDSANSTIYTDTKTSYKSFSNIYASLADAKLAADNTKGRASSISRDYWNTEFSWTNLGELFSKKYSLTAGLAYGSMKDVRQDVNASGGQMMLTDTSPYSNPSGSTLTSFGQTLNNYQVNMNRDETDTAYNLDQFIQGKLSLKDSIDIHAGARHTYVSMDFKSKIPVTTSPSVNMNGAKSFERTTPVLGAIWKVNPTLNVYANYGEGFETPTLIEMAYNNASTATGPNLNLKPSWSNNYEIGAKAFILRNTSLNVAIFKILTKDEIIVSSNSTYSVYGNAPLTKREGLELSLDSQLPQNIGIYAAYTFLDAKFNANYTSGVGGASASGGGPVNTGNKIPGTYKQQLYGEVSWAYPNLGFKTAIEGRVNSKVFIDDINSAAAPGYGILNMRAGFEQRITNWKFSEYLRVENLLDKSYIGAVRVNDNNFRNFEPASDRNYLVGVSASYQFK